MLAASLSTFAQSGRVYRIGVLDVVLASASPANMNAFLLGMREAGYVEGRNLIIDYRSADGRPERFPELAADLVRAKPDIIVTRGTVAALAAKAAGSIPIVMATSADPIGSGVVPNFARPGGTVTGLATLASELGAKRLEILKDLVPPGSRIAAILNLGNPNGEGERREIERAARSLGLQALVLDVRDAAALTRALATAVEQRAAALLINAETVVLANRRTIVEFSASHELPAMYSSREFVDAGGLMSYGVDYPHHYYRAASYVDKILKGAKPGDLPIEQPSKLNLVINLKSAKALGITIPRELLLRADQLVQ